MIKGKKSFVVRKSIGSFPWFELVSWFKEHQRPLPWRKEPADTYRTWISEVMSQQSTLKTVVPRFEKWMARFPDLESLAKEENETRVLKIWAGLGYYSRARNLLRTAKLIYESGRWPSSVREWESLPGVGPYTARAIVAIGQGKVESVPLDGNITRVGSRYFGIPDPLNTPQDRRRLGETFDKELLGLPKTQWVSGAIQGLMELGALLCRPQEDVFSKGCPICPLNTHCKAYKEGRPEEFPKAKKRPPIEQVSATAFVEINNDLKYLALRPIPKGEPLEGQWEIPWLLSKSFKHPFKSDDASFSKLIECGQVIGPLIKHSIMNKSYQVQVRRLETSGSGESSFERLGAEFIPLSWVRAHGDSLTTLSRKILQLIDGPKSVQSTAPYGKSL